MKALESTEALLLPMAGRFVWVALVLLLAPCAGSGLTMLGGGPWLSLAMLRAVKALPPADDREVTRDEARLLALRLLLAAFVRDFCGAAAGVSFEAPPVRPEGCNLPALLLGCSGPEEPAVALLPDAGE